MILSIKNLSKLRPLENAAGYRLVVPELDVRAGEKILITGPSGSGKSTFLDLLGMVLKPDRAERFLFSPEQANAALDVAGAWMAGHREDLARWRRSVGYVLQTGGLLPFLSVRENILTPRRLMGLQDDGTLENLAHTLNIEHLLDNLPQRLSVGERQRAAIARALAAKPALVLADEPTAALDPLNAQSVLAMFSDMVSRLGITLILVTHAPEQMKGMGFRRFAVTQNTGPERVREATLQEAVTGESI